MSEQREKKDTRGDEKECVCVCASGTSQKKPGRGDGRWQVAGRRSATVAGNAPKMDSADGSAANDLRWWAQSVTAFKISGCSA